MGKVICVRLPDENVWREFLSYVGVKHGFVKGSIGMEVANALREYLERHKENAYTHTHKLLNNQANYNNRTLRNLQLITAKILERASKEISQTEVERIITETVGGDLRTHHKYIFLLNDYGVLKPLRPIWGTKKMIFEVNVDAAKKLIGLPV